MISANQPLLLIGKRVHWNITQAQLQVHADTASRDTEAGSLELVSVPAGVGA